MIRLHDISFSMGSTTILHDISLTIAPGKFIGVVGPNGSGKSTMLKILYRYLIQQTGRVTLYDKELQHYTAKQFAKQMAVVSQESPTVFDFTVQDLVLMGRMPYKKLLSTDNNEDFRIVARSMAQANVTHLAKRTLSELSGGEKKRVMLARALAQEAEILVLDEPTNHLDIQHQLQLMDLVKGLPITIIAALHDLNLAAAYCDELFVMNEGHLHAFGTPEEVLTEQMLADVFGVQAHITQNPLTKKRHLFFYT